MNVKNLAPNLSAVETYKSPVKNTVKAENSSADRDPSGRRDSNSHQGKDVLTDEELEQALNTLKSMEGVKGNSLNVELVEAGSRRFVLVTDPKGELIRKIPENELWVLLEMDIEKESGKILNKAG